MFPSDHALCVWASQGILWLDWVAEVKAVDHTLVSFSNLFWPLLCAKYPKKSWNKESGHLSSFFKGSKFHSELLTLKESAVCAFCTGEGKQMLWDKLREARTSWGHHMRKIQNGRTEMRLSRCLYLLASGRERHKLSVWKCDPFSCAWKRSKWGISIAVFGNVLLTSNTCAVLLEHIRASPLPPPI